MKVSELIGYLSKFDPDHDVLVTCKKHAYGICIPKTDNGSEYGQESGFFGPGDEPFVALRLDYSGPEFGD